MKQFIYIILLVSSLPVLSQQDKIDSLLNDLLYSDVELQKQISVPSHLNFIYAGANFNSNTYYAGREIGTDRNNITGYVYFYSTRGFFIGASGNWYDEITPGYSSTIVTAGYYKTFDKNKTLTFRSSYSRFFYNEPDTSYEYPYKNNFNLGLSYRKKWFGARVTPNILIGEEFGFNLSFGMNSRFTLLKFGKSNKINLMPDLSFFIGSETIQTSGSENGSASGTSDYDEVYGLLNTQLYLPLSISIGSFDFEFGYTINFPITRDKNISYPVTSNYSFSIGYILPVF